MPELRAGRTRCDLVQLAQRDAEPGLGQERCGRGPDDPAADDDDVADHLGDRGPFGHPRERADDPVDLGGGVVVGQSDPDDTAGLGEPQPLDQADA